ncbi:hypothetical protein IGI04_026294, partial [Brassica rapa subsp. trilocularis]
VIEANDSGWVTFVCDSVCLEKPYVCKGTYLTNLRYDIEFFFRSVRQTACLGSRLAVDDLPGSRLAVDDLPGSRLVNAESRHAIHKTYHKQNYYRSFLYKDKLGFHLSRQDQTTFKKSRRLLRSPDDFQETTSRRLYRKSRRLLGSPDDFHTTNRTLYNKKLPNEEKSDIRTYQNAQKNPDDFLEVQTTSWKSRRLPGSPDDFVRRLPRSPDDFQTTSRRLTGKSSQKSSRSEKPAHQIQI